MSKKTIKKIEVEGFVIRIEPVNTSNYISLTDIAKKSNATKPDVVIQNWLKNTNTIRYLHAWERIHNPDINPLHLHGVLDLATDNRLTMSPKKWIKLTNAIGLFTKMGRGGGTFAHQDIALNFCYWLSPEFQVYFIKEFQRLKEQEFHQKNLEWHISKITDNIEEVRNLLDTIPFQNPERNRIKGLEE